MTKFERRVYEIVRRIPKGRVATYRAVARAIGKLHASRAVGNALNKNPRHNVPCHRVIRTDGKIGGFARGTRTKRNILLKEGVKISRGRVDKCGILRKLS